MDRTQHRRSRLEVINEILSVASFGARKTHIMYRANLSYDQLNEYLGFLLDSGLIEKAADTEYANGILFRPTERGTQFLDRYSALQDFLAHSQTRQEIASNYLNLAGIGE